MYTTGIRLARLAGLVAVLLSARAAGAQETPAAEPEGEMKRVSQFGAALSDAEALTLLREMRQMTEQALATSRAAEQAGSVPEIKAAADRVFETVWGRPSGVSPGDPTGAVHAWGWKEQWQVTGEEFSPGFVERLGSTPPRVSDPRQLGVMGRGRAVRGRLEETTRNSSHVYLDRQGPAEEVLASLNNVVGWTYVTTGLKGREEQPRISLTHVWDAPPTFWNTTADTGWLVEAEAQAINILKTDYAGDLAEARRHVAGLTEILTRVLQGVDADRNGRVDPAPMEGGLIAAADAAARTTLQSQR